MKPNRRTILLGALVGFGSGGAVAAHADEKGAALLRNAFSKLHEAQTMTADLTIDQKVTGQAIEKSKGTVTLKKPNYLNVTLSSQEGPRTVKRTFVSDGTNYFIYSEGSKNYTRQPVAGTPTAIPGEWEGEVNAFFGGDALAIKLKADFAGTETIEGTDCNLIRVNPALETGNRILTYAIGRQDHLIRRTSWTLKLDDKLVVTHTTTLSNVKLNGPAATSLFAFGPPKDSTLFDPEAQLRNMEKQLVSVGEDAPPFELTDPRSKGRVSLAKVMDGRKAVLVNFWFYN